MSIASAKLGQYFLGRAEGKVMEHDDHFLHITAVLLQRDHRRCQELLLGQRV
jgi:hypothetical protein